MRIRKSQNTMTGMVISLLLVIGLFIGGYQFIVHSVGEAGNTLDPTYNSTYQNLTAAQTSIENNVEAISDNLANVTEADSAFSVAWNGLKGLGNTLKLPYNFLNAARTTWGALVIPLEVIPSWASILIFLAISTFIIFLVLKILKGEPNM